MHEWASRRQQEIEDIEECDNTNQDLLWIPVNNSLKKEQIRKTTGESYKREVKGDLMQFETKDFMHKGRSPIQQEEQ